MRTDGRTDGRTDRHTDGQRENIIPTYVWRGIKSRLPTFFSDDLSVIEALMR